jgi:hypothetical protein
MFRACRARWLMESPAEPPKAQRCDDRVLHQSVPQHIRRPPNSGQFFAVSMWFTLVCQSLLATSATCPRPAVIGEKPPSNTIHPVIGRAPPLLPRHRWLAFLGRTISMCGGVWGPSHHFVHPLPQVDESRRVFSSVDSVQDNIWKNAVPPFRPSHTFLYLSPEEALARTRSATFSGSPPVSILGPSSIAAPKMVTLDRQYSLSGGFES